MKECQLIDYVAIGKRVRKCREENHLTQEQLAERAELSLSHMGHVETANTKVSLPALIAIANALHVTVDTFVCESLTNMVPLRNEAAALIENCSEEKEKYLLKLLKTNADLFDEFFSYKPDDMQ